MTIISRNLHEDVTHWPVTGSDGYGGFTYGTAVKVKGRWEEKAELFLTNDREEKVSSVVAYLGVDVDEGDYLGLGDLTATNDPTTIADTFRIQQRHRTTDLRNLLSIRKAFL